jgi:HK97 family phage portal protein
MNVKKWLSRKDMAGDAYTPRASVISTPSTGHMKHPVVIAGDGVGRIDKSRVQVGSPDILTSSAADSFVKNADNDYSYKSLPRGVDPARSPRARFFDPLSIMYATGFKDRRYSVSFDTLRNVSYQLTTVGSIIKTRVQQVASFAQPYRENKQIGFQIKFKDDAHQVTEDERRALVRLEQMIMECGFGKNRYVSLPRDNFKTFLRKIIRDSCTFDHACMEVIPDKMGRPFEFRAVDASTIRFAATFDGYREGGDRTFSSDYFSNKWKQVYGDNFEFDATGVHTVQLLHGRIENIFTYNDLAVLIRNPRSDIWVNQYGFSEIEQALNTILAKIWAEEYNRRAFTQGSHPKGILNISGDNISPELVESFKRQWYANMAGVENSWKTPILQAANMQYQNLQNTNREMEFQQWLAYLRQEICSIYDIDPTEIGFEGTSGGVTGQQPMFESKKEWKIKHSKDRGLRPLLSDVADWISRAVIDPLDSRLYFDFVGLDELSEVDRIELQIKKSTSYVTVNEVRAEEGLPPISGGDVVNSGIIFQAAQAEKMEKGPSADSEMAPWSTSGDGKPDEYGKNVPVPLWIQGKTQPAAPPQQVPGVGGMPMPGGNMPMQ